MGAFLLYKRSSSSCVNDARYVFTKKGLSSPKEFNFGKWTLLQYRKVLVPEENHVDDVGGASLHACGTVIYCGLGYQDSLHRLLADFQAGRIDQEQLLGSFTLIFWRDQVISILTDRSRTFHVFSDDTRSCISSSFLAVLAASPTARHVNRLALCEKLATGYIVSPDTLIDGILQVDGDVGASYHAETDGVRFLPVIARPPVDLHLHGLADSLARQTSRLKSHFQAIDPLHVDMHGDLGMSSGYDSRLVLACSNFLSKPMDLHTHGTQGIHDAESNIVREIADSRGLTLNQVFTRKIEDHSAEEIATLLTDGLYFYDGRCSHNMGAFSEVYTRMYKSRVMQGHMLGWNGLGGEMYRNYYFTADRPVTLRRWMDRHVYYPFAPEAWGCPDEYEAMHYRKVEKMTRRLGPPINGRVDFLWLRQYYSEIRMPDCDAANNDALNQLVFFHTPFMDSSLVGEAINATPYIGCDGLYQASLIRKIDPELSTFMTHYGHSLNFIPLRARLRAWSKCQIPESIQRHRIRSVLRHEAHRTVSEYVALAQNVPILSEIRTALCDAVLRGRFEDSLIHYAQRPTAIFVGSFLREFQHKICW